jgi:hypothetical protein
LNLNEIRQALEELRLEAHADVAKCKERIKFDQLPPEVRSNLEYSLRRYTRNFDAAARSFNTSIDDIEEDRAELMKALDKYMPKQKKAIDDAR